MTGMSWTDPAVETDGAEWRLGSDGDIAWIRDGTSIPGEDITVAVPAVFEAHGIVALPSNWEHEQDDHDAALVQVLREGSSETRWWLGYLDTGADDLVFPHAPTVTLYSGWRYVLVQAGPEQALSWRHYGPETFWKGHLPNLMFPADRSWLITTLWDDDWACIGGPETLVAELLAHPQLAARARRVTLGERIAPGLVPPH